MRFKIQILLLVLGAIIFSACGEKNSVNPDKKVVAVDTSLFFKESLVNEITQEKCVLSHGTNTMCYKIVVKSEPKEHKMGPWCPERIDDTKDKGGIWIKDGKVYDVDGKFIADLDDFYADPKWKLHNDDGSINITKSKEACEAAARPNVDAKYNNYCVQCSPDYYKSFTAAYLIPVTPLYKNKTSELNRAGALGLAFNGVGYDPPAPVNAIIGAHTIAPFDDCGGHVNPHAGYHYHAAKGCSKENNQEDGHSPMLGYALDGFGIFALLGKDQIEPTDLDQCRGHSDDKRGYHYHVGKPGDNQIIACYRGEAGTVKITE